MNENWLNIIWLEFNFHVCFLLQILITLVETSERLVTVSTIFLSEIFFWFSQKFSTLKPDCQGNFMKQVCLSQCSELRNLFLFTWKLTLASTKSDFVNLSYNKQHQVRTLFDSSECLHDLAYIMKIVRIIVKQIVNLIC